MKKTNKILSNIKSFEEVIGKYSDNIDKHIKSRAIVERRLKKLLSTNKITQEQYEDYMKDRTKARKELFLDKNEYITPTLQSEIKNILSDLTLFEAERKLYENSLINRLPNKKNNKKENKIIKEQIEEKQKTEEQISEEEKLRDFWGNTYEIDILNRFQKFYKSMTGDKEPKSEIYKIGLIKFTRYSVLAEDSAERGKSDEASRYEKLASEVAKNSGIQIGEIDESISSELYLHPLWFKYVEEAIDVIPKWIELESKAFDELDVYSWATTNYNRHLFNLPPCSYKEMFDYIYEPYVKFLKMKKLTDEEIEIKKKERIKGFENLDLDNNIDMQEPLYIKENINEKIFEKFKDDFDINIEEINNES